MSPLCVPTKAEQDLLDFARQVLGSNLSEFLLSGLGEPHLLRRRFAARSTLRHKWARIYQFEIVSGNGEGLPGGRDPVVLAALMHLLWTRTPGRDEVVFRDEELLEKLGWPETPESRLTIEEAVERYFSTAYYIVSRKLPKAERIMGRYSQVTKLITGYEMTIEQLLGQPGVVRKSTVVKFLAGFYEEVTGGEKYFFRINFENLNLQQLPADNFD